MLKADYLEQMRAHVDEGGKLSHKNGVELLTEVERLRKHLQHIRYAHDGNPSDECAMLPEADYARLIMHGMRNEAREALEGEVEPIFA